MSEKTFVNLGVGGGPVLIHVKDGRIIRCRPLVFGDDEDVPTWTLQAHGQEFSAPRKVTVTPFSLTERARVYSKDRILYPMKRVDWDPQGNRNTQNRGKSAYERISWDEALDIISGEMKRIRSQYGPEAINYMCSSHHNAGN